MQTSAEGQFVSTPSVLVQAVVPPVPEGLQLWHGLLGLSPFAATNAPEIQHPDVQLAVVPLHTSPDAQLVFTPSVLVQVDVLVPGWQL